MAERITEIAIEEEVLLNIERTALDAKELLRVKGQNLPTLKIIETINNYVCKVQNQDNSGVDIWTELCIPLGCLWGGQFVNEFKWEWAKVIQHDHDDMEVMGVFSKNRSLSIYPWYFLFGCIENKAPVTITLAYNMYRKGSDIPKLPDNGYENMMEYVHYIIPPK